MADSKVQVGEVVPVPSKIAENKLTGTNYLDWSKIVRIYMRSIDKDDHLHNDPPIDDTKQLWLREDARLLLQIRNSIDSEVLGLINHCEFVKELMDYLEFLYPGKGNVSRIYDVCRAFYRPEKETKTLTAFFMDFKKTYEKLNVLLPSSSDIKVQQAQREQMAVMSFLGALPPEFDAAKSHILSGTDITSLQEVFSRVLRTESTLSNQQSSVPVAIRGGGSEVGRRNNNRGDIGGGDRGGHNGGTSEIVCYYCKEPGHTKHYCKKLQNRNQRAQTTTATVAATSGPSSEKTVTISVDEYAKLAQRQESVAAFAESGKKYLISSSNKWVIDSGATDHMTGNPKIFSSFRSHTAPSPVTIANGSNYTIEGSGTIKHPLLLLPYLLYSVYPDLMTKQTIGKGHVSDGLYILDAWVPRSVACSGVVSPFEAHCRLGHPSLPVLKKLCPQFHDVSSMDCESDNAKEYMSGSFQNYMNQHGILHQSSCADTPDQNGVAERKNRHLLETARALLFQMKVPKPFCADAISTACFLINRMPSTVLNGDVPYSVLFPTKTLFPVEPQIFGSTCFIRDVRPHLTKLDPKALKCVFLGYSRLQKGYRCYSPDLHRYLVSTDVVFSEHSPLFSSKSDSRSKGEDDDRLMYEIFPSVPTEPAISEDRTVEDSLSNLVSVPIEPSNAIDGASSGVAQSEDVDCLCEQAIITSAPVKPPIVQVYSQRREHHDTCPEPASSSSDPPPNDLDLPIGLRKGEQLGDILTKSLNGTRVEYLCNKLGMINIYTPA
ncbi:hypothetical protein RJ639_030628 [Escallonia herrerae]|uniref:Integrase catalytic domain-containing protein n=1 Tax=Escallonia herrerae TaxID=1293975 RepID=A0AA88X312_9ASTE|nr:hypothetical protein RJ639_030628 [Escallonia herrerae]